MAFAALGGAEVLRTDPRDRAARDLLQGCASVLSRRVSDNAQNSAEPRPLCINATIAEALVVTGKALRDEQTVDRELKLLSFLLTAHTQQRHLWELARIDTTPDASASSGAERSIDMATFADACASAYRSTSDPRWLAGINLAWHWFLAQSPNKADRADQCGLAGLSWAGSELNAGSASMLAILGTAQQAHLVHTQR